MFFDRLPWRLRNKIVRVLFARNRVSVGSVPRVAGFLPNITNDGKFTLGRSAFFRTYRTRQSITVRKGAILRIGDDAFINDGVDICSNVEIVIGDHVKIAPMAAIYDSNYHKIAPSDALKIAPIIIGNNVWIGVNAVILPGSTIGDHSVIAAGAVVSGPIPPCVVAGGSPAKTLRTFEITEGWIRD